MSTTKEYSFSSLNTSAKNYLDVSDWAALVSKWDEASGYTSDELTGAWTLSSSKIRFELTAKEGGVSTGGSYVVEWSGNFKIKGDRVVGGTITGFERNWGDPFVNVKIDNLRLSLRKAKQSLVKLSVPSYVATDPKSISYAQVSDNYAANRSSDNVQIFRSNESIFSTTSNADYSWVITNLDGTRRAETIWWRDTLDHSQLIYDQLFSGNSIFA